MKVTVIGAGNVGATCANEIINMDLVNELVLVDINEGMVQGKALDLWQTSSILQFDTRVRGVVGDYEATAGSDVIVITSGLPRKPGMSRDDLISVNAKIVKDVTKKSIVHSPQAKIIVVSNPLDVMTYAAYLAANEVVPKRSSEIFGMAGILDTARYKAFIAEALNLSPKSIHAILMGGHGDTMVPLPRYTSVASIPIRELMDEATLQAIIERTKTGGGEIVKLMGTSAWYAPGAAAAQMVEAIIKDSRRIFPVCASLNGEYGLEDIYLGVPVVLGKKGIEKIIELDLLPDEKELLYQSAKSVKEIMVALDDMNLFEQKYGRLNPIPNV
ncbi:MAG: malate dehydrogenase [Bacteroidetes bacterium GWA2_40_14]|jgi:malate dehydrogenase|nr:malate dehydrogenase [Salinivirgaceae bacterium]OFX41686.1 MAG: malate dehydrogenase [Bacteroidetes bacterium GWA2_40_14]HAZ01980.1 malate dehydrogenase [Marinilabiliales bacterium]